jgi:hypothetical protein
VGRQRDDPFAPVTFSGSGFANDFVKGKAKTVDTGYFYGPSNCLCDYFATNFWGDGSSSAAFIRRWPGFARYFLASGTHTYASQGDYTTTLSISDLWAHSASANGSAHVTPK